MVAKRARAGLSSVRRRGSAVRSAAPARVLSAPGGRRHCQLPRMVPGVLRRASEPRPSRSCTGITASCATEPSAARISASGIERGTGAQEEVHPCRGRADQGCGTSRASCRCRACRCRPRSRARACGAGAGWRHRRRSANCSTRMPGSPKSLQQRDRRPAVMTPRSSATSGRSATVVAAEPGQQRAPGRALPGAATRIRRPRRARPSERRSARK